MIRKVVKSLLVGLMLIFFLTSTLTTPVATAETVSIPVSDITTLNEDTFILVGGGEESFLKFEGIDLTKSIVSAALHITGLDVETEYNGMNMEISVMSDDSWITEGPPPSDLLGPSITQVLNKPELDSETNLPMYSIDVSSLLADADIIGDDSTISLRLSSDHYSVSFSDADMYGPAPRLVIEYAPADTEAPIFSGGSPSITATTTTSTTLKMQLNEPGTVYYVLLADGATAPNALQVKAGTQANDTLAAYFGSFIIAAAGIEEDGLITGLSSNMNYDLYVVADDELGNLQSAAIKLDVQTLNSAPTGMTLSSTTVGQAAGIHGAVGILTTTDADLGDTHTYALVSGAGDQHNNSFNIAGSQLRVIDSTAMSPGAYSIRIRTTDGANATFEQSFTITVVDDVEPAPPIILTPGSGTLPTNIIPVISGTAEPSSTVEVFIDGSSLGTSTTDGEGIWTYTPASELIDGEYDITATATDAANNTSVVSPVVRITIDTTAPSAPIITSPSDGTTTSDTTPTIIGTAEENSSVEVFRGGTSQETVTADDAGNWTYTPTTAWTEGSHSITARATDEVGNTSVDAALVTVIIDITAPDAPIIKSPADGTLSTDSTPTISGTAEVGSTVEVFIGGVSQGNTTADGTGNWTYTPASSWSDGTHSVTARATDEAGNTSAASTTVALTIDTTAPNAPMITSPIDGATSSDAAPAIRGTAEANSSVEVFKGGVSQGTTPADSSGNWTYTPAFDWSEGTYSITARATDTAGNLSVESLEVTLTIDTTAPSAPIITSPIDGTLSSDPMLSISGTSEADSIVEVFKDGLSQGTTPADGSGNWTYTPASIWGDGTHSITAKATDTAGNTSAASTEVTLTIDSTPPSAPIITSPLDGAISSDVTPTISGTAEAGSLVEVFREGISIDNVSADGSGNWAYTPSSDWTDGTYSITATATDTAGNTSISSTAVAVTIDTIAPSAPIIESPIDGTLSKDTTPVINGTAEADSTVEVFREGLSIGSIPADGSGNWAFTPSSEWMEGTHSITARATDTAGNTSGLSTVVTLTIDATAPNAPIITRPLDGALSSDVTPTISGTAEANSKVELFRGGVSIESVNTDGSGNWSYTPVSEWPEGKHSITATATDAAGNTSTASLAVTLTIDITAPSAPIITSPLDGAKSSDVTPTIRGTAEAGSTVEVFRAGVSIGTTMVGEEGNWTFTPVTVWSEGTYSITARATDAARNTSIESTAVAVTIDTTAPSAPTITSPLDGTLSADASPTISGTAEAASTIEIFRGGLSQGTTTADGTGNWTYTPASSWPEGKHSITSTATDEAGNTSAASTAIELTIDTIAPNVPIINSPSDGASMSDATPTISGTAEAVSSVELFIEGISIGSVTADVSGNWTYTPASDWSEGTHSITAKATDAAGNTSATSTIVAVTIDTIAPNAPIITSPLDGALSSDAKPTINGTTEASSTVEVFKAGVSLGSVTADASGNWTFTSATDWTDGLHSITAKATDAAGNTSIDSTAVSITIDATAPGAPIITSPSDGAISADVTPTISGTAEIGSTVELLRDGASQGTATADGSGNWTYTPVSDWSEGTHLITAKATDAAGNTSAASTEVSVTIDTTAPAAPVITSPQDGSLSSDVTPTISGTSEADSIVEVLRGGASQGTTTADGAGNWTYTPASDWSEGTYSITAKATDAAGNTGIESTAISVTIDTTAPNAPVITSPSDGTLSADGKLAISGTAEAGSKVEVLREGVSQGTTTADGSGNWTYTPASEWLEGKHSITAKATDAAGNTSAASTVVSITIDKTAPSAPIITSPSHESVSSNVTPVISGTAEAGSTVEVFKGGVSQDTITADGSENWTYTPASDWAEETHSLTATATDAAGNTSVASTAVKFTIDTTAPNPPVITSPLDGALSSDATLTISGTAEASSKVEIFMEGSSQGTVTADSSGNWTYTPASELPEGKHSITARATDAAGNKSTDSIAITVTIDATAPSVPVISSPTDGTLSANVKQVISGTAEASSKVEVFIAGVSQGTATADEAGNWTYTPASDWTEGKHSITAKATDAAGNTSAASVAITVTIDRTAPNAPIITSPSDGTLTVDATPTISGTAETNSTVEVFKEGVSQGTTTADTSGNWSYTPASEWTEGKHTITARATDAAGNTSTDSLAVTVTIDATAPSAPIITSPSNGASTSDATPTISGTAETGSTVEVFKEGVPQGTTTADASGNWTYTPASDWADGLHSITARATDVAGNTSVESTAVTVTIDATAPSAPVITSPSEGMPTSDTTPTISGTAEAGSTVEVLRDGVSQGTATADEAGNWTYTPASEWPEGKHSITASATDAAGNTSAASVAITVTIDRTAPSAPIITSPSDGTLTVDATPTISGTAEANSSVEVFKEGVSQGTTTADASGNWTYTPASEWTEGKHSITARSTDAAGNTSTDSLAVTVTIDSTAPSAPIITSPSVGVPTSDATPTISGTAEAGSTVEVFKGGVSQGTVTANESGNWTYTPASDWADGLHSITARATDAAGKTSGDSTALEFIIDTTSPVISLKGDASVRIVVGTVFVDEGASAIDSRQGDLTSSIVAANQVDSNKIGTYIITYQVSDDAGNEAIAVQRTVTVIPPVVILAGGSGGRIAVSDAIPGATLTLYNDKQIQVGEQGTADREGAYVFSGIGAGQGYYVTQIVDGIVSNPSLPVNVTAPSRPSPSVPDTDDRVRQTSILIDGVTTNEYVDIVRDVNNAGKVEDKVVLGLEQAKNIVEKALKQGSALVSVLIDDLPNEPVDEIVVSMDHASVQQLSSGGIAFEIRANNATASLSHETLQQLEQQDTNMDIRFASIRKEEEKQRLLQQIIASEQVKAIADGSKVSIVDTPIIIKTNVKNYRTNVILPLHGIELPNHQSQSQQKLAVYIESVGGAKSVQHGSIVYDANGRPVGIQVEISNSSTLSVFSYSETIHHMPYVSGYSDGTFAPNRTVTRAELAAMLSRLLVDQLTTNPSAVSYSDVATNHWAVRYLANVQQLGLMGGYPDGSFRPDRPVTRAEFAKAVVRLLDGKQGNASYSVSDIDGHWAYQSMISILEKGAMKGYSDGTFRPNEGLTRAEAVSALNRIFGRQPLMGMANPYSDVHAEHWAYGDIMEASVDHSASEHTK